MPGRRALEAELSLDDPLEKEVWKGKSLIKMGVDCPKMRLMMISDVINPGVFEILGLKYQSISISWENM